MVPPSHSLPVLARVDVPENEENRVKWDLVEIVEWLATNGLGTSLDALPQAEKSKTVELMALYEALLDPSLLFNWYSEPLNYPIVAQAYSRHLTFPMNIVEQTTLKSEALALLKLRNLTDSTRVYKRAAEAYQTLSFELGTKPFLLGTKPSFIDALIIGHLALALHAPMDPEASNLMMSVQRFPNLVTYVDNALRVYLRNEPARTQALVQKPFVEEVREFWEHSLRPIVQNSIPFLGGVVAMISAGVILHNDFGRKHVPSIAWFSRA